MASLGSLLEHFEVSLTFYLEENYEGGLSTVESLCFPVCENVTTAAPFLLQASVVSSGK